MYGKYSLPNLIKAYNENKDLINAHLKGMTIENYGTGNTSEATILGLGIGSFALLCVFSLILWIWAVVILIENWNKMPLWAAIVGLLAIFTGIGGPILTIILVYATRKL